MAGMYDNYKTANEFGYNNNYGMGNNFMMPEQNWQQNFGSLAGGMASLSGIGTGLYGMYLADSALDDQLLNSKVNRDTAKYELGAEKKRIAGVNSMMT